MKYVASVAETWFAMDKEYNFKEEETGITFREKNHIKWISPVSICWATKLIKREFVPRIII